MKRIIALLGLFALLIAALLWVNDQRKQTPAYILSQYPQTQTIKTLTSCHLQNLMIFTDASKQVDIGNLIFFSTWFVNQPKPSLVMHNLVDGNGVTAISRIVSEDTSLVLQTENSNLTNAQLSALRASFQNLPPSQPHPTLSNLYILSFRDRDGYGDWTTRIYDKSKLPPEIVEAHKIAVTSRMAGTTIKAKESINNFVRRNATNQKVPPTHKSGAPITRFASLISMEENPT